MSFTERGIPSQGQHEYGAIGDCIDLRADMGTRFLLPRHKTYSVQTEIPFYGIPKMIPYWNRKSKEQKVVETNCRANKLYDFAAFSSCDFLFPDFARH